MSDSLLSTLLRYAMFSGILLLASAFCIRGIALFLTYTRVAALLFIVVILSNVNPGDFGYLEESGPSVYIKGVSVFFFPLFQYYLYGLFLATLSKTALQVGL